MIGVIDRNKDINPKCATDLTKCSLKMRKPLELHNRVNCIEMANELNHTSTDIVQKQQINTNSMPHQSAFVYSVQSRKKHRNKKLPNMSSKVRMSRCGELVDSMNDYHDAHNSDAIELNATQCSAISPTTVIRNHSELSVHTVNRPINNYRQRLKTNYQWSSKTHSMQALVMCFAMLVLGVRITLVSANAVTVSSFSEADDASIAAAINESATTMSSIIQNHLKNTLVTTTEHPRRAAGSK